MSLQIASVNCRSWNYARIFFNFILYQKWVKFLNCPIISYKNRLSWRKKFSRVCFLSNIHEMKTSWNQIIIQFHPVILWLIYYNFWFYVEVVTDIILMLGIHVLFSPIFWKQKDLFHIILFCLMSILIMRRKFNTYLLIYL